MVHGSACASKNVAKTTKNERGWRWNLNINCFLLAKFVRCVWRIVIENHFKFKCLFKRSENQCEPTANAIFIPAFLCGEQYRLKSILYSVNNGIWNDSVRAGSGESCIRMAKNRNKNEPKARALTHKRIARRVNVLALRRFVAIAIVIIFKLLELPLPSWWW